MKTVTVEIKKDIALTFLHNLESMHVLRVIEDKPPRPNKNSRNVSLAASRKKGQKNYKKN